VTKEHREHLAEGAKKRLTQAKQDLRNIQHKFQKIVGEKQLSAQVPYTYKKLDNHGMDYVRAL
jgi:hypothetical protein